MQNHCNIPKTQMLDAFLVAIAAQRAPVGGLGLRLPQKFAHGFYFVSQQLSRKQVSKKMKGEPPSPPT